MLLNKNYIPMRELQCHVQGELKFCKLIHWCSFLCRSTQRWNYNDTVKDLEFQSNTTSPALKTGLELEKHAAKIYTHSVFNEVQQENSKSMRHCYITNVDVDDQTNVYTVTHLNDHSDYVNNFQVFLRFFYLH